jgi:N-acetylglucosamine-6-sulfatase
METNTLQDKKIKNVIRNLIVAALAIILVAFSCIGCSAETEVSKSEASEEKPNFIFILTDDQRFDAMGFMGHPFLKTPNIDRLRNEGGWFKNAFCTTSLCSPSRASFLTGTHSSRHGIMANDMGFDFDFDKTPSYHQILRDKAGYNSAYVGKWHMGLFHDNPRPGFDYWLSFKDQGVYIDPELNENGRPFKSKGYVTDILNDAAVKWLGENAGGDKPFVMYLSHKAVHQPFLPATRHKGIYKGKQLDESGSYNDPMTDKPLWQRALVKEWVKDSYRSRDYRKEKPARILPDSYPKRKYVFEPFRQDYYEAILAVDDGIGAVMNKLEAMGQLDNTVIIFSSDNGFFMGEHRMGDKRCAYEESIRIPMVIRYPKLVKPGTTVEQMVLNIDLAPTFYDLAGVESPSWVQGDSMVRLFKGSKDWRNSFLYSYWVDLNYPQYPRTLAVRTEDFKLVTYPDTEEKSELYDLKNDPLEMDNLIDDPAHGTKVVALQKEIDRLVRETDYKVSYAVLDNSKKQGLMLKFDFENSDGKSAKDLSGNSNDGVISSGTIVKTEKGSALKCIRQTSVTVKQSDTLDTSNCPLTVSLRFKAESDGTVMSQGDAQKGAGSWSLFVEDGIPCFAVNDGGRVSVADGMESSIGKWVHVVATVNHDKLEMFVDGKKVALVPRGRYLKLFRNKSLTIGKEQREQVIGMIPEGSFEGLISDVEFYRQLKNDPAGF